MSRNGSGVMSITYTFAPGETITAAKFNTNYSEIVSEITNSVAADGQTSMTGPLKASSGTAAAPSHTFAADTDTGMYRRGANQVGFSTGGTAAGYFDENQKFWGLGAADIAGALNVQGALSVGGFAKFPLVTADYGDASITYAKVQNVTNNRMLGNTSGGAAAPSEQTITQILDMVGSAANGDILIRSGGAWTRLAKATDGNALILTSGVPAWGGTPPIFKLSSQTASSSAALAFTGLNSDYTEYRFVFSYVLPATDSAQLIMEVSNDNGGSWQTTNYLGGAWGFNTGGGSANGSLTTAFALTRAIVSNASTGGWCGECSVYEPSSTAKQKNFRVQGGGAGTSSLQEWHTGSGAYNGSSLAINAVRFRYASGNIASGKITQYGVI